MSNFTYEAAKSAKLETLGDALEAAYCIRALAVTIADRLNDERHRTLCRAFIGEQQPGIGGHDANKRECRKI